uniref:Uncharacterized protein n=1 Tax=Picea glauca TaxID=3330 RepID=A0A117NFJ2_PICGL|nr:hypothetical protein ABT39_MTgene3500 [Picea glauca]
MIRRAWALIPLLLTLDSYFLYFFALFLWIYRQRCNVGSSELRHYCLNL